MKNLLILLLLTLTSVCKAEETYVNRVWYFGNNQFYIYLNYNEGYDWNSHEEIKEYLGEPRSDEFESTRRSVPKDIAEKYFEMPWEGDLLLLDNKTYSKLGTLSFEGVEYYEDMITSSYVAVFNIRSFQEPLSLAGVDYFCISSNASTKLVELNPKEVDSDIFENELQKQFGFEDRMLLRISSIQNGNKIFTLCSFYGENYDSNSVLMESVESDSKILNSILQDEYVMWDMIVSPLIVNSKPVLIIEMGVPETDNNWTEIAIFNGTEYTLQPPSKLIEIE